MVDKKGGQLREGASCAWVPSPTAGTLHAMHYHLTDVSRVHARLGAGPARARLADILTPPLAAASGAMAPADVQRELENNAQGILGYVVRWIQQGVGCSKVPDLDDVGLMEDRATLRISSQLLANWLLHKVISKDEVMDVFRKMAVVVDKQNSGDALYVSMAANFDTSNAVKAALELVFDGTASPNGYTEPLLTKWRRREKAESNGESKL